MRHGVPMHRSARIALGLLLVTGLVVAGALWADPRTGPASSAADREQRSSDQAGRWEPVLQGLLGRRAAAFAAGEPAVLGDVYVPASRVRGEDRAVLRVWARRGLTVEGATVRVAAVQLVRRAAGMAVLRTVDRLGPAVAVDARGATRALPRDRLSAHRIVLFRTAGGWRIATVR